MPPRCFVFLACDLTSKLPKTLTRHFVWWESLLRPSCSCLVTLSELIHSRPNLWRPQVLRSRNPRTAHITQEQMQQVQGQRSARAPPSHSSSLLTLRAKNKNGLFYQEETEPLQGLAEILCSSKKKYYIVCMTYYGVCTLHKSCRSISCIKKCKKIGDSCSVCH